jgi:hypothetical protein
MVLYVRGIHLSTGEFLPAAIVGEVDSNGATWHTENMPSYYLDLDTPASRAAGPQVCNRTFYLIYLYS